MAGRVVLACVAALAFGAASGCGHNCDSPTSPCNDSSTLTGRWSGSSSYINAPFTIELQQSGTALTGQYRDQKDTGSVSGTLSGSSLVLDVNFGDTGMRMTGTAETTRRITGDIFVPVLGNRTFSFVMTR